MSLALDDKTPSQHLVHYEVLLGHAWIGAYPRQAELLSADTRMGHFARMGHVYSLTKCSGNHGSMTLGEETIAGVALVIAACGGASVREGKRGRRGEEVKR